MALGALLRVVRHAEACKEWADKNPEVAADWDAALAMDEEVERLRELSRSARDYLLEVGLGAEDALRVCGSGTGGGTGPRPAGSELHLETLARAAARRFWAQAQKVVLVLLGGTGSGKTLAAAEALLEARQRGLSGCFVPAIPLSKRSYFDLAGYEELVHVPFLVLDDLGAENLNGPWQATLDGLVAERVANARRTVITANVTHALFEQRYAKPGSRIGSRLAEHGLLHGVGSEDLRRKR